MMPLFVGAGAIAFLLLYVLVMRVRPTVYIILVILVGSFLIGVVLLNWSLVVHVTRLVVHALSLLGL